MSQKTSLQSSEEETFVSCVSTPDQQTSALVRQETPVATISSRDFGLSPYNLRSPTPRNSIGEAVSSWRSESPTSHQSGCFEGAVGNDLWEATESEREQDDDDDEGKCEEEAEDESNLEGTEYNICCCCDERF